MNRHVNTSYFTKGSQTPTGQKEFKYDLKSDNDNQGNSGTGSEVDELSQLDMSEYVKEKNPESAFKHQNITVDGSVDGGKSYMTGN